MNPLAWIQGLEGPGLIVAICVLLFEVLVGVLLTIPYAIVVNAHLVGTYTKATDAAALPYS